MLFFVGALIVIGSVIGGFMWHGGQVLALHQPNEILIIGGAALGSLIIATPVSVIKGIIAQIKGVLTGAGFKKQDYLDLLVMMYEIFNVARRDGLVGLENHIEHPEESSILQRYPKFQKNHHAVAFFADTMRIIISGSVQAHDLEDLMDSDLEVMHEDEIRGPSALATVADSLPGLRDGSWLFEGAWARVCGTQRVAAIPAGLVGRHRLPADELFSRSRGFSRRAAAAARLPVSKRVSSGSPAQS